MSNPCLVQLFDRKCITGFYTEFKLILSYQSLIGATW